MSTKSPKKSLLDYFKPLDNSSSNEDKSSSCAFGRPTRACASKARQAWNSNAKTDSNSSSDEEEVNGNVQSSRKRGRATLKSKQTIILSSEASIKEKTGRKKKVKLDPETEEFLRSGVPDVILKCRAKSLENDKKKELQTEPKAPPDKRKTLDAETLAFLHSGVPDVVVKAQHCVDKRRIHNEEVQTMGFFPKTNHTFSKNDTIQDLHKIIPELSFPVSKTLILNDDVDIGPFVTGRFKFMSLAQTTLQPLDFCCEESPIQITSQDSQYSSNADDDSQNDTRPWIDKLKVSSEKNLVVDGKALETLRRWLKLWRSDIKDDGGTSRKQEKKKKRGNSSDSDFLTSNEEENELKKKSVLLTGPSGCAKTAAVYVLAKHFDFEVVEVNFSSRRPGKEVLQRVEEAVLSHHIKTSHNCLLLFKDIDLLHPVEDEGFFSAVAQLITTAVRPIVMTSCLPAYALIDSKLDRKDPLRISFAYPKPHEIVKRILKPIFTSSHVNGSRLKSESIQVEKWLDSIVRHCGCDIRQSINQLQLLLSTSIHSIKEQVICLTNDDIHLYSSPFQSHLVDLNFPRQSSAPTNSNSQRRMEEIEDEDVNFSVSARKKKSVEQLESLGIGLELLADLDCVSRISPSSSSRNLNAYGDMEEAAINWNHSDMRKCFFTRLTMRLRNSPEGCILRELVLESDTEVERWMEIDGINDDIGQYCDRSSSGIDWECCAAVRTIVKRNLLDSFLGRGQKRNGRHASYFNRLDKSLVEKISNTFGFRNELQVFEGTAMYND